MRVVLVAVLMLVVGGCTGLEPQRVREERAAFEEWRKAIPLIKSHPGVSEDEKKSWELFERAQEFRIRQQEEAIK